MIHNYARLNVLHIQATKDVQDGVDGVFTGRPFTMKTKVNQPPITQAHSPEAALASPAFSRVCGHIWDAIMA